MSRLPNIVGLMLLTTSLFSSVASSQTTADAQKNTETIEKAKKQLVITKKQYKLDAAEQLDVITSKQNVLVRENTLLSKKYELLQQKKKISFVLNHRLQQFYFY